MKKVALLAVTLVSIVSMRAEAQDLKADIRVLLAEIKAELVTTPASTDDLIRVRQQLTRSLDLVKGSARPNPPSNRPPRAAGELTCVSKDNDGMEPYQVAVRDLSDFSTTKIPGAVLSRTDCQATIKNALTLRETAFICASYDGDKMNPFAVYGYNLETRKVTKLNKVANLTDCQTTIRSALTSRTHAAFCVSKDNDSQSPFTRMSVELATGTTTKIGETYSSLATCNQSR